MTGRNDVAPWKGSPAYKLRLGQQSGLCFLCGKRLGNDCTRDHLVPRAQGGSNGWDNIVLAHAACNNAKCKRMPTQDECERFRLMAGHWPSPSKADWTRAEVLLANRLYVRLAVVEGRAA